MEKKTIKDLKRGEYFTLSSIEEPRESQVWVRGEYIPEAKAYSTVPINGQIPIMKYSVKVTRKFTLISPSNHQKYGTEKI